MEELNFDNVQRGLIQKRKVFNSNPQGIRGFAFNTRKPPFDDIRVRKALTLLLNRKQIIEKIMFNEYVPLNSFYRRHAVRKSRTIPRMSTIRSRR